MTRWIQRCLSSMLIFAFVIETGGCSPVRSVIWSPDGTVAALMTEKGIFFAERSGRVLTPELNSAGAGIVDFNEYNFRFVDRHTGMCATIDDKTIFIHKLNIEAKRSEVIAHFNAPWSLDDESLLDGESSDGLLAITVLIKRVE